MRSGALPSSFRDPSGFVYIQDGVLRRQVNEVYRPDYEHLMASGLYDSLVGDGLLVEHREVDAEATSDAFKVLAPQRVPFVSYPYEWCFGQLQAAALATLAIQSIALDHGMSLRDASAYNIQFLRGRPVLIDTLSFERLREGTPWIAYRQFCQHFLAPLALMSMVDVRLGQLSRLYLDGVPLNLASELLPGRSRLRPAIQLHIHSHGRSQDRHAGKPSRRDDVQGRFSLRAFRGLVESLRSAVEAMEWQPDSHWNSYYDEAESYSEEGHQDKLELVGSYLSILDPDSVWDLGANTGLYSRLATERGAHTVSFDMDPASVETNYRDATARKDPLMLPLVMDLANTSPAIGWRNRERMTLSERGPVDVVMALALVHHLAIGNNVPLPEIARAFRDYGSSLLIEFVPKSDPKVRLLLSSREDIFPGYDQAGFEAAFGEVFTVERRHQIRGSDRILYLMRAR